MSVINSEKGEFMKKETIKKASVLLLSAAITGCMLPAASFADETPASTGTVTTQEQGTTATDNQTTTETQTDPAVQADPLSESTRAELKSLIEKYDASQYDAPEAEKIASAIETAKTNLDSAQSVQDANKVMGSFYVTVSKLDTKVEKELKAARAAVLKKISAVKTSSYNKKNAKKIAALKKSYSAKVNKAGTPAEAESAYKAFKSKKAAVKTKKQEKALANTKKKYINLVKKYKAPKAASKKVASYKASAIKKIQKAKSESSVKSAYKSFKSSAASAARDAKAAGHNFIYTADGKKIYEGRTYHTSYWGDKESNRTIKVTYVDPFVKYEGFGIQGGNFLTGVDVKNGGYYDCSICTKTNSNHKSYEHGIVCCRAGYGAYGKITKNGTHKGMALSDSDANGAVKWLGNGWQADQITIRKSNITVVETINGTEPTLDHYYSRWTRESTGGKSFSTYKWGMGTAEDGTVWSRATQWVRVYEGNKVVLEEMHHLYSWDE